MFPRRLSYMLATCIWIACAFELAQLVISVFRGTLADEGVLGRLLTQANLADRAAPLGVVLVFSWILVQVAIHASRIVREAAAVQQLKTWAPDGLGKLSEKLRAGQRAKIVLKHQTSSPSNLLEALPAAGALDAVALDNGYTLLKTYVWMLPVFGFIGTAWGMAHAIGGFSDALKVAAASGASMQIELLTNRLGQYVIPGLANAFSVTMLALGASIVAHFWTTTLQAWDQDVLSELDRACAGKLADIARPSVAGSTRDDTLVQISRQLIQVATQLSLLMGKMDLEDAAESLGNAASSLQQSAEQHVSAALQMHTAASELHASVSAPYHITISREAAS